MGRTGVFDMGTDYMKPQPAQRLWVSDGTTRKAAAIMVLLLPGGKKQGAVCFESFMIPYSLVVLLTIWTLVLLA
jgi:hypothetical protein